jgi:hypothetical protein
MSRLEAMAQASMHGGYDPTMTSDPLLVSKAVLEWWWVRQGNRAAFPRPAQAPRQAAPPAHDDAALAAAVLQVEAGALDMACIRFEDMAACRRGGAQSLDLVSARDASPRPARPARRGR